MRRIKMCRVYAKLLQSYTTLRDPMDCNPPGSSVQGILCPWNSLGRNTGIGCHFLLQGTFPNQRLNPDFLHCRQILYHLSHQMVAYKSLIMLIILPNVYKYTRFFFYNFRHVGILHAQIGPGTTEFTQ